MDDLQAKCPVKTRSSFHLPPSLGSIEGNAMLLKLYVRARWLRLTTYRYVTRGQRIRHAGVGRALRTSGWARAHGDSTGYNVRVPELLRTLRSERTYR